MEQFASLAARHALPVIYPYREETLAGGLMSYGSSRGQAFHQVGIYAGRILRGDKPAGAAQSERLMSEVHCCPR